MSWSRNPPDRQADQVGSGGEQVLEASARCITRWDLEDTAIMLLTDSPAVYRMLKHLPNRSRIMAVAVASGDELASGD